MPELVELVRGLDLQPIALVDIGLTALLIYGLFLLIRGTRAVRLVIGVTVLGAVYLAALALGLKLLTQILQTGAVLGLLALVVVFQPELRRALERIGRVGSLGWLLAPGSTAEVERVVAELSRAAAGLAASRVGALIVIERETGLEDFAEAGVMLHADLNGELLRTIFTPHAPLHDGAVIVRGKQIVAASVVLPLSETSVHRERFGTRHRAALGITEQTDALAIVVSEESGAISLVERGRILRALDEERLRTALLALLRPGGRGGLAALGSLPGMDGTLGRGLRMRNARARRNARRGGHVADPGAPAVQRRMERSAPPGPAAPITPTTGEQR
jgi:diadenylate cyclase